MSLRQALFFSLVALRGKNIGKYYRSYLRQVDNGIPGDTTRDALISLLDHCRHSVPYYAKIMGEVRQSYTPDPIGYLRHLPILTKDIIREHYEELKSADLGKRRWFNNTSGGSTGEPVKFIQDRHYETRSVAISLLFSKLAGRELGEREIQLWGSMRDIARNRESLSGQAANWLANTSVLNAFRMHPAQMERYLSILNSQKPRLILAYVQPLYELARFAEQHHITVKPQNSIITSAGTLYPFMREVIERVFQCKVYNRYGSREVGDVACERPGIDGLWVAPWGNYIEIVDEHGNRVPDGTEGELLITSLTNYAMPLLRFKILDRGYLQLADMRSANSTGQILGEITGRRSDSFKKRDGTIIAPNYFNKILYFKPWIRKFQVIQKDYARIVFVIERSGVDCGQSELEEIICKTRLVMGPDCQVDIDFVDKIPENGAGKYRYFISEVQE